MAINTPPPGWTPPYGGLTYEEIDELKKRRGTRPDWRQRGRRAVDVLAKVVNPDVGPLTPISERIRDDNWPSWVSGAGEFARRNIGVHPAGWTSDLWQQVRNLGEEWPKYPPSSVYREEWHQDTANRARKSEDTAEFWNKHREALDAFRDNPFIDRYASVWETLGDAASEPYDAVDAHRRFYGGEHRATDMETLFSALEGFDPVGLAAEEAYFGARPEEMRSLDPYAPLLLGIAAGAGVGDVPRAARAIKGAADGLLALGRQLGDRTLIMQAERALRAIPRIKRGWNLRDAVNVGPNEIRPRKSGRMMGGGPDAGMFESNFEISRPPLDIETYVRQLVDAGEKAVSDIYHTAIDG